jgi:hypothetical protein
MDGGQLPPVPALPPGASLWHVGVHKTGTTTVQGALAAARPRLREHGVLYPGRTQAHHAAALGVLGRSWGWQGDAVPHPVSHFTSLVDDVRRWQGRSVVSSEHLCEADDAVVARIADAVGRERLHVVITVRPLGRLLPSSWQQYLKFGFRRRYDVWLENQFAADPQPQRFTPSFWMRNAHGALVQRWVAALGPEHVDVVVLEGVSHDAVLRVFADLLGVPHEVLVDVAPDDANRSMTAAECELLRRLNRIVRPDLSWADYERVVRDGLVRRIVEERVPPAGEPRLHTPDWALDAAAERGARDVAMIEASGARVVGRLDLLAQRTASTPPVPPAPAELPADLAAEALAVLVRSLAAAPAPTGLAERAKDLLRRTRS